MHLNSIAFIPDGNRRYAQSAGISLAKAYSLGTQKAWEVLNWLANYPQIRFGTFYTLSLENLSRSKLELKVLFSVFEKELDSLKEKELLEKKDIKLKFIGKKSAFPKKLQEKMEKAEQLTQGHKKRTIFLALGYNGQQEIVDAAKKIAEEHKTGLDLSNVNEHTFKKFLYGDFPEPDLIIRTSGTQRLSGFLTYQSAYSELYFTQKYWPELTKKDIDEAISDFHERKRKFGK
ncbi:MAG: di-trans,poly-cis-decaprenylcistransferase [Candidatus Diapherotrites archaeon]|nr:di-trans,poly-cis-decaprenylcistransferase [Candidatus Diapherotrites archaeon]